MTYAIEHIVSDADTCFGKPRINGTRFTVKDVVGHHYYHGMPLEVIAAKWNLPISGVFAAIAYYFDHKEEIDNSFEEDRKHAEEMKTKKPSILAYN